MDGGEKDTAIEAESYRQELEEILGRFGLGPECLAFVDEFPGEPLRALMCQKIARKIIFKRRIGRAEKEAAIAALHAFGDEAKALEDDRAFLKHGLIKHICSIQQRWQPEYECAKWAFYQLKRL